MRHIRPRPLSHVARRYAWPAVVALVVHGTLLFWPDHRATPHSARRGGVSAGPSSLEVALVEKPSPESAAATDAAEPRATEPRPTSDRADEAPAFTPPPPPTPRPDLFALVELPPREATSDVEALAAALREAAPGFGSQQGAAASLASLGDPSRSTAERRGEADGHLELFDLTQLDCEPALLRVPEFQFPTHLSRQGLHAGRVTVVVRVNASGRVSLLSVTDSSHPDLIPAVCDAVAKALFQPPVRQGRRVALRYSWTLELKDRTQIADRENS